MIKKRYRVILDMNVFVEEKVKAELHPYIIEKLNEISNKMLNNDKLFLEYIKFAFCESFLDSLFTNEIYISKGLKKRLDKSIKSEEMIFQELSKELSKDTRGFLDKIYFSPHVSSEDEEIFYVLVSHLEGIRVNRFHFKEIKK